MSLKRYLLFLVIALFAIHMFSAAPQKENELDEYQVKSILLYRICKFTQWPQSHDPSRPFVISVLGRLPNHGKIALPEQADIYKRKIIIKNIRKLSEAENSDVLFIASTESHQLSAILDFTAGRPILTVGDTKGFGRRGVIINFFIRNGSIAFEINHDAAKQAAMEIHSRLYAIATVIKDGKVIAPVSGEK